QDHLSGLPAELKYDIIGHIPLKSLGRLARVSRLFHEIVTPVLYKADAGDEQPRAIFWAANATRADEETITRVLDLAKRYGGNVNRIYSLGKWKPYKATPLQRAATTGNIAAARKLLELGANVNALRRELPAQIQLDDPSIRHAADRGTINILHILSAEPEAKDTDYANRSYFESLRDLINVPIREGSTTPLFLALRHQNGRALKKLIVNGANIEALNEFGRTLLTQAIRFRFTSRDAQARQWYNGVAEQLVKSRKSKVSNYGLQEAWETPLTCTIKALEDVPTEYKRAAQDAGAMLSLLQKHGANINEISNEGITVLHAL
ncbi:ankyrin, partial [Trichoderma longibrachiatum ATCC 18648]